MTIFNSKTLSLPEGTCCCTSHATWFVSWFTLQRNQFKSGSYTMLHHHKLGFHSFGASHNYSNTPIVCREIDDQPLYSRHTPSGPECRPCWGSISWRIATKIMDKKCQLTPKFRSVERNGRLPDILGAARVVHLRISPPGIPGQS